jgi:Na+/H+ antiporter NhaD/arsenite permease-like protein
VVALAVYERMQGERVRWGYYMKVCYPAMMTVILVSNLLIYLFHLP